MKTWKRLIFLTFLNLREADVSPPLPSQVLGPGLSWVWAPSSTDTHLNIGTVACPVRGGNNNKAIQNSNGRIFEGVVVQGVITL